MSHISKEYLEHLSSSIRMASDNLKKGDSIVLVLKNMKTTLSQRNNPLTLPNSPYIEDAMEEVFRYANDNIFKGVKSRVILNELEVSIMETLQGYNPESDAEAFILESIQKVTAYPIPIIYNVVNRSYIRLFDLAAMLDVPDEDIFFILGKVSGTAELEYHRDSGGVTLIHESLVHSILNHYSPKIAKAFGDRNLF